MGRIKMLHASIKNIINIGFVTGKIAARIFLLLILLFSLFIEFDCANAQTYSVPRPPLLRVNDSMGVNLADGKFDLPGIKANIGNELSGLNYESTYWSSNHSNLLYYSQRTLTQSSNNTLIEVRMNVSFNGQKYEFIVSRYKFLGSYKGYKVMSGVIKSMKGDATFECPAGPSNTWRYVGDCYLTTTDGTRVLFDANYTQGTVNVGNEPSQFFLTLPYGYSTLAEYPNGEKIKYYYKVGTYSLVGISSNLGWAMKIDGDSPDIIRTINLSKSFCDIQGTCNINPGSPNSKKIGANCYSDLLFDADCTIYNNDVQIAHYNTFHNSNTVEPYQYRILSPSGVLKIVNLSDYVVSVSFGDGPMSVIPTGFETSHRASSVVLGSSAWFYNYGYSAIDPNYFSAQATDPLGGVKRVFPDFSGRIERIDNELGQVTKYEYGYNNLISKLILPGSDGAGTGGYSTFSYDNDGNILNSISYPFGGGNAKSASATYTTPCSSANYKICHKPITVIDPKGNQTDFVYDANHGGVLTETMPADGSGVRPQTRYEYAQLYAKILNSSGQLINADSPIYRLTKVSKCKTATAANPASCVGSADENITLYSYDSPNLFITSVTNKTGDSSISQTISYVYDEIGNKVVVDGPRTDVDDRSFATFDVLRRPVYEIDVDPDGGGPQRKKAIHHLYDIDGREWKTETGTCGTVTFSGDIPVDCADFIVTSFVRNTYDASTGLLSKTEVVQP